MTRRALAVPSPVSRRGPRVSYGRCGGSWSRGAGLRVERRGERHRVFAVTALCTHEGAARIGGDPKRPLNLDGWGLVRRCDHRRGDLPPRADLELAVDVGEVDL